MGRYTWNLDKLPGWAIATLEELGLPLSFREEELTLEQRRGLVTLHALIKLWEEGFIECRYIPGEGVEIRARE